MAPNRTQTDVQLIELFLAGSPDEAERAFDVLMKRNRPIVMKVCRHYLNYQDAEDACQATFLALALKARTIQNPRVLRSWLCEVASRIALRQRTQAARRRALPPFRGREVSPAEVESHFIRDELRLILRTEIDRLPDDYRAVVVHCHLKGRTNEEAARVIGCPVGTVKGRLWRARWMLRERLLSHADLGPDLVA
jgi:RNA polymerase sigma factor (sigma-70 family)